MMTSTTARGDIMNRRKLLHVGGLSLLGLNTLDLVRLRAQSSSGSSTSRHRANSCVFIFLFGGPSHIDLWDMKPSEPAEVRGEFNPASTAVSGIQICEHLPRLAQQMDKLCLLRSMTHRMNVHGPACSQIITGRAYPFPPITDQARPEDWPSLSSLTMRYGTSHGGLPSSIVLPWYLRFTGQSKDIAGQTSGRMGRGHDATLVKGDPRQTGFALKQGFTLQEDVSQKRLAARENLLHRLDAPQHTDFGTVAAVNQLEHNQQQALALLKHRGGRAFDLDREPQKLRERYGTSKIGQSFLLARRLIEADVSLVTINWEDRSKISATNTCWDTHRNGFPKLKSLLCPLFDRCFSAFLEDLHDRGLLETTLVVAVGEFGRTPKLGQFTQSNNTKKTGRDHWPHAFTALLAGGGVRGGQVYGATTKNGGYVAEQPVTPADLTATVLQHLGIDATREYFDEFLKVRQKVCLGTPIRDLG